MITDDQRARFRAQGLIRLDRFLPTETVARGREDVLRRWGAQQIERVPAVEALIRTATATDADVLMVSRDDVRLHDGVGAILRYADATTNHH